MYACMSINSRYTHGPYSQLLEIMPVPYSYILQGCACTLAELAIPIAGIVYISIYSCMYTYNCKRGYEHMQAQEGLYKGRCP